MTFNSGRQDMSRADCDNMQSEEFPSSVATLVKLFVFDLISVFTVKVKTRNSSCARRITCCPYNILILL